MINRNPKIRILAVLLVLTLVGAGAAPVRTACAQICRCGGAECHGQVTAPMAGNTHGIRLTDQIPGLFYPGEGADAHALPHQSNSDCRKGLAQSPCHMVESSDAFEALQGTPPTPPRNEHCQDLPFISGLHIPSPEHHLARGLPAEQTMSARAAPVPVFLRTLSLLI